MRILFVIHQFYPEYGSGTERVALELARSAQRDGHRVIVLTRSLRDISFWHDEDESGLRTAAFQGLKVVALPQSPEGSMFDFGFLEAEGDGSAGIGAFFDRYGPFDVAHVMHCLRMFDVVDEIRARRIAYIVTLTDYLLACYRVNLTRVSGEPCDGPEGGRNCAVFCPVGDCGDGTYAGRLERTQAVLLDAAFVTTCSPSVRDVFERVFPALDVEVIEHGVDLLAFGAAARERVARPLVFGFLGTLTPVKGAHVLMRAFIEARLGGLARLEIVGPCFEDEYLAQLRGIADLDGSIVLKGAVSGDGVRRTLGDFDVLCIPSTVPETFSLALHEGFASGLPCLVSDLGHPASVVRRHGCGDVVPPGDVARWADSLARWASRPDQLEDYRRRIPVPHRIEEEAFRYMHKYHLLC